jgi:hypothetical protein
LVRVKRVAEQREWLERWEKKTQPPKVSETFRVSEAAEDQTSKVLKTFEVSDTWKPKNPSQVFSNFFNSYAKSINKRYNRTGSLFQYKFKRKPVTASKYFLNLIHYIHFNPQKHRFVEDFRQYPWSSYNSIISEKPTKLRRQDVLDWFSGKDAYTEYHTLVINYEKEIGHLIME